MSTEPLDAVVIGGGPAGVSAALTLARQMHPVVLFDSGEYRNGKARHMHTVAGWDDKDPKDFRAAARRDLQRYGHVQIADVAVVRVAKQADDLFEIEDAQGAVRRARKLVLAVGVEDLLPDIEGYKELWVTHIFHCLFCHGYEERGAACVGILAVDPLTAAPLVMHIARMATPLAPAVTIYTNGDAALADAVSTLATGPPFSVERRRIARLAATGRGAGVRVEFADGSAAREEGFLTHHPRTRVRGPFVAQLGLAMDSPTPMAPSGDVQVEAQFGKTSVPGVFAAGDCASRFKIVTQAVYGGSGAGAVASMQVTAERLGQQSLM